MTGWMCVQILVLISHTHIVAFEFTPAGNIDTWSHHFGVGDLYQLLAGFIPFQQLSHRVPREQHRPLQYPNLCI
ncbi:hypothetical protein P168DRAFT_292821 [Aspergillus campestris IBT 28561]|uniref:Secreted protein n=1 Tax=Aspergillus campestris (strain IBT 28561) TaxID=1392248 RepID=A0A2I1CVW2_ASPC2|nr:uncharacterized protein P168DRAFT_292821 [Aspergillus campestris IBT 28561]PKY01748.1 hypothetical protein P168DRAFT_292821 [Aspergillus campestris IBT 28561]